MTSGARKNSVVAGKPLSRAQRQSLAAAIRADAAKEARQVEFQDSNGTWYVSEDKFDSLGSFFHQARRHAGSYVLGRPRANKVLLAVSGQHIVAAYMR